MDKFSKIPIIHQIPAGLMIGDTPMPKIANKEYYH
jgi:hypothetical protein